jgi:hypothetical protein
MKHIVWALILAISISACEKTANTRDGTPEPAAEPLSPAPAPEAEFDYRFEITRNGIYTLDEEMNLLPLHINDSGRLFWEYIYGAVVRIDDILFFHNPTHSNSFLFYDCLTKKKQELELHIVQSIYFASKNRLTVNGLFSYYNEQRQYFYANRSIEIEFENRDTPDEIIRTAIYESSWWQFYQTRRVLSGHTEEQIEEQSEPQNVFGETYNVENLKNGILYINHSNIFLFTLFNKKVMINCENIIPEYDYANIGVSYYQKYNTYFISIDNAGRLE